MDTPLTIVLVEDHDALRDVTVEALEHEGHDVTGVASAEDLSDAGNAHSADLYILDLKLPGEDGLSLASRIRASNPTAGIIMVTARTQPEERSAGYDAGADIYLTKPTSPTELIAAVRALARRIKPAIDGAPDEIRLHLAKLELHGRTGKVGVSLTEAQQLVAFLHAKDQQLESWQLIELGGREADDVSKKTMEVQMVRLRKKLTQIGAEEPTIKSLRGLGYRLCVRVVFAVD